MFYYLIYLFLSELIESLKASVEKNTVDVRLKAFIHAYSAYKRNDGVGHSVEGCHISRKDLSIGKISKILSAMLSHIFFQQLCRFV